MKKVWLSLPLVLALLGGLWLSSARADEGEKLFINLTSDEIKRAGMAIGFAHRILEERKIPVTIFLNVEGVRLADTSVPQAAYPDGKTPAEMLRAFIADGGTVIACPMCMKNVGGTEPGQLLDGVQAGGPDVTWPALFAPGTRVLSY
jgi:sulfur relay (sulfurtransferase) complex TusBCD TusD component (DsrE family)